MLTEKKSIEVKQGRNYEPGVNLFLQDGYHMGQRLGKEQFLLFHSHANEEARYVIVVNERTGESVRVEFKTAEG